MQHCSLFFLHGKRLHPCKMPLGTTCIVALLFEKKCVVAPECRFPPGGRVSIPPRLLKPQPGRRTAEKEGVWHPKNKYQIPPKSQSEGLVCIFAQTERPLPRVEKKAGEKEGVAGAPPSRKTADGNADRREFTAVFGAFTEQAKSLKQDGAVDNLFSLSEKRLSTTCRKHPPLTHF